VSTWCDILCRELADVRFTVYALTGQPEVRLRYELPVNAHVVHLPLWGAAEPTLQLRPEMTSRELYRRKRTTGRQVLDTWFVPLLRELVRSVQQERARPDELAATGKIIHGLWRYFQHYDWLVTWRSEAAWDAFREEMTGASTGTDSDSSPSLADLSGALRWLYHYLMPLNAPLAPTDLVHTTIAGFAGLAGVVAKHERGTPFLVTEHGVWVRERYIAVSSGPFTLFAKRYLMRLSSLVARLNYFYADLVCPVADFNRRWELPYGATGEKLRSIYNGIDPGLFVPRRRSPEHAGRPVVVAAARVFPLKDLETMILSAALARERLPRLLYLVYGSLDADPSYTEFCRALIEEQGLGEMFRFCGYHTRPQEVYSEGDISVLSSVSEGFPYTVLESMACARPVVATDVGGVREALEGFGIVVPPRDPQALADGVVQLMQDDQLRLELGRQAREAVLARFRIATSVGAYGDVYRSLTAVAQ
jgi:glycosyltransferase involved in cell wall biosynthesis